MVGIITSKQHKFFQSDPVLFQPKLASVLFQSNPVMTRAHLCDAILQGQAALKMTTLNSLIHAVEFLAARATANEIYLFQIKYSFEKFRNAEAMQEYNSILYSYVA